MDKIIQVKIKMKNGQLIQGGIKEEDFEKLQNSPEVESVEKIKKKAMFGGGAVVEVIKASENQ